MHAPRPRREIRVGKDYKVVAGEGKRHQDLGCVRQGRGGRSKPGGRVGGGGVEPVHRDQGREIGAWDGGGVAWSRGWQRGRTKPGTAAGCTEQRDG